MSEQIWVRATEKRFRALTHQPSGEGLDDKGEGLWPADAYTFRFEQEGALKRFEPDPPAKAPSSNKGA